MRSAEAVFEMPRAETHLRACVSAEACLAEACLAEACLAEACLAEAEVPCLELT